MNRKRLYHKLIYAFNKRRRMLKSIHLVVTTEAFFASLAQHTPSEKVFPRKKVTKAANTKY